MKATWLECKDKAEINFKNKRECPEEFPTCICSSSWSERWRFYFFHCVNIVIFLVFSLHTNYKNNFCVIFTVLQNSTLILYLSVFSHCSLIPGSLVLKNSLQHQVWQIHSLTSFVCIGYVHLSFSPYGFAGYRFPAGCLPSVPIIPFIVRKISLPLSPGVVAPF